MKRLISLIVCVLLIIPTAAYGKDAGREETRTFTCSRVNPEYADLVTEDDLDFPDAADTPPHRVSAYYNSITQAADEVREQLRKRSSTITIGIIRTFIVDVKSDAIFLMDTAMYCTGAPDEGDYISHQWKGWNASISTTSVSGGYLVDITYYVKYMSSAYQEETVDAAVPVLLDSLDLDGKSDYEKLVAIYGWLCDNVTYDYARMDQDISHTAYAALIQHTSVCQGYALLLYRLLTEVGIDCRYIKGDNHAWNIVKLYDRYYNVDATWDAGDFNNGSATYFLRCNDHFRNHTRSSDFDAVFDSSYPMAQADYPDGHGESDLITSGVCGPGLVWSLENGVLTVSGSGEMYGYDFCAPWRLLRDEITDVRVSEGVGSIGEHAFYKCGSLEAVDLPQSLTSVEREAFYDCGSLTSAVLPAGVSSIGDGAFFHNFALSDITILNSACSIYMNYFTLGSQSGTLIHGFDGSSAQSYALFYNFRFAVLSCESGEHAYVGTVTDPTCTEGGYTTYVCAVCGDSYTDDETEPLGHDYKATVTEPGCTEGGYTTYICSRCGDSYTDDETKPLGHDYKATVTEPTCTEGGYTTYICSRCGDSYTDDETKPLGHNYIEEISEPTCVNDGYITYTCARCGSSYSVILPASGHDYRTVVTEPTCTEGGYTTYTCVRCGDSYTGDEKEPLGHDYVLAEKVDPTCSEDGYTRYECSRCGSGYSVIALALGHDWGEPTYVWADDYSEIVACRVCLRDGTHTETEKGEITFEITVEPTVEKEGEIKYTAVFTNPAFTTQTVTAVLPRTGDGLPCSGGDDCPGSVFTDMPKKGHWAHDAIDWALVNNITAGTTATTFSPGAGCTRAQVVTFLWKAAGSPEPGETTNRFVDVKKGAYYEKAVLWAVEKGITAGIDDTHFGPGNTCTRAQIVTFLWRFEDSPEPETNDVPFTDVGERAYYRKAVAWATENGITGGIGGGLFGSGNTCTRAQIVTFLYKDMVR